MGSCWNLWGHLVKWIYFRKKWGAMWGMNLRVFCGEKEDFAGASTERKVAWDGVGGRETESCWEEIYCGDYYGELSKDVQEWRPKQLWWKGPLGGEHFQSLPFWRCLFSPHWIDLMSITSRRKLIFFQSWKGTFYFIPGFQCLGGLRGINFNFSFNVCWGGEISI